MKHLRGFNELFESVQELTQEQKDWLDKCARGAWSLNPKTGLVDVNGEFYCSNEGLTDFKGVGFGEVTGNFYCSRNALSSLDGAPRTVGGNFSCFRNNITSLEGGPLVVRQVYQCDHNSLTTLKGAPESVGGSFCCYNNSLTSLEGTPKTIGRHFDFSRNYVTSLEGAPQKVGSVSCYGNPIGHKAMAGVISAMSNHGISLEEAVARRWRYIPEEDKALLAKHNPKLTPDEIRGYEAFGRHRGRVI